jgi:hypothetical protein
MKPSALASIGLAIVAMIIIILSYYSFVEKSYSELFFNDPENLPLTIVLDEEYTFSITINEDPGEYLLKMESEFVDDEINFNMTATEYKEIEISCRNVLDKLTVDYQTIQKTKTENDINEALIGDQRYGFYLPNTHNIPGLGDIYHINHSIDMLEKEPFKNEYIEIDIKNTRTQKSIINTSIYIEDGKIISDYTEENHINLTAARPFVVKLYKVGETKEDVKKLYFWYKIK